MSPPTASYKVVFMVQLVIVVLLAALCAAWDWRTGRIPNIITVPALVGGLFYGAAQGQLVSSLLGVLVGGGLYAVLVAFEGMGGGDMKMGAALGAWGGFPFAVVMLALASIFGGIQALWAVRHVATGVILAVVSGQGIQGAQAVFRSAFQPKQTVPYGVSIGLGAIAAILWPILPGSLGTYGREVYALLAAALG